MNDELLMKFIDGKTTPEETEVVVAYLSAHPEEAQEWMQMEVAARLADTRPAVAVSEADAASSVARRVKPKVVRLNWIISAVTAVAASVVAVVMFDIESEAPGVMPPPVS
jgi:anti-sigma factor RsiW